MTTIYIECSTTMNSNTLSGIQRVVRSVIANIDNASEAINIKCVPVFFENGKFVIPNFDNVKRANFVKFCKNNLPQIFIFFFKLPLFNFFIRTCLNLVFKTENQSLTKKSLNDSDEKDNILLLLDSSWLDGIWPAVEKFKADGGRVCAVLYDLIPFSHPETVEPHTRKAHKNYWKKVPLFVDSVVCISQSVRQEFIDWQIRQRLKRKINPAKIGYFYLGSNLDISDPVIKILSSDTPYFLVVGSIEPRKNQSAVIDAFDKIWVSRKDVNLVFVGSNGWKNKAILERIQRHAEYGKKIFLIRDASDKDLISLYKNCQSLIVPSLAEGFGLPIVEGMKVGAPIICSDIPVFHEVGGDFPFYFNLRDPKSLYQIISKVYALGNKRFLVNKKKITIRSISWRDSTIQLLKIVKSL